MVLRIDIPRFERFGLFCGKGWPPQG